jgi:site-specific DNA recombinase
MPSLKVRPAKRAINQLILAVAYYRMSSDKQDTSIDEQRREVEAWAESNGYKIIRDYVELGISGDSTNKRKAFQRLIADAETGDFQAIVCWDQDRFGRFDSLESGFWIHPLRELGIHLATVGQGIINWTDFQGRMIFSIQTEAKHQFLVDLSRNTTRGELGKAMTGQWVSGPTPFGYASQAGRDENGKLTHRLVLGDEGHVALVIRIFDAYDGGASLRGIRDQLNSEGKNPRTGNLWHENSIKHILTNPLYTGDYIWPRASYGRYHRVRDGAISREKGEIGEQIILPDNHPAVISREQFQRVAERLKQNRKSTTPLRNGGNYLLTGLLYCKNCGSKMYGFTNPKGPYQYYRCSGNTHYGQAKCGVNNVRQDELLGEVCSALEAWASDPKSLTQLDGDVADLSQQSTSRDSIEVLEAKKANITKKLLRAEERLLIVDDDMIPRIQRQVRELVSEREAIIEDLKTAKLPTLVGDNEARIATGVAAIRDLGGKLEAMLKVSKPEEARTLLGEYIERIDVQIEKQSQGKRFRYTLQSGEVQFVNPLKSVKLVQGSSQRGGLT